MTIDAKPSNHFQYTPFTLECYVEKTGQNQILWLKNGEKMKWNARFTTDYSDKEIDGVMSKGSTLTFETSNESDIGKLLLINC